MERDNFINNLEIFIKQHANALIVIVLGLGLFSRLFFAAQAEFPGHADTSFYYTVAENIAGGRGLQIDFIWHYLLKPGNVTHPANDYWMVFPSVFMSISMFFFGKTVFAALVPSILFGAGVSVLTYFLSQYYSDSKFVAFSSAGLTLFSPVLFTRSLMTDTAVYYVFFAASSIFFMLKGRTKPGFFLVSSVLAAFTHLTRQDGIFLVPVLLSVILCSSLDRKTKSKYLLSSLLMYLLAMFPYSLYNYQTFGSFLPKTSYKTAFLTNYEDIYSYSKELSLRTYLEWGWVNIIWSKIKIGYLNIKTLGKHVGFLWFFLLIAIVEVFLFPHRNKYKKNFFLPLSFFAIIYIFYTVIVTFPGFYAFNTSPLVMVPFLLIASTAVIERYVPSKTAASLVVFGIAFVYIYRCFMLGPARINAGNKVGQSLVPIRSILQNENPDDVVIMTRNPWELYVSTKYKAIQIPNDDLETIIQVAERYRANYLLLPAPRKALSDIYTGRKTDRRIRFVSALYPGSSLKLFRFKFNGEAPKTRVHKAWLPL